MRSFLAKLQIGKNGVTTGVTDSIKLALKNHKQVRISVLKSANRDKQKIREVLSNLKDNLPKKLKYRVIGFTIIVMKV